MEKKEPHPILVNDELINERGVVVFDQIHGLPVCGEPYIAPYFVISLNMKGWARLEYDMRDVRFEKNDVAIIHLNHAISSISSSPDYHAILLVMSSRLTQEMKNLTPSIFMGFYQYVWQPQFRLTDEQHANIVSLMRLIKNVSESDMSSRESILKGLLHILATFLMDYRRQNGHNDPPMTRRQELFIRFHQAIVEHYRESREVRFYADLFCLSPKHFAAVIKQQTGIMASDWISNYVMIQAKTMLHDEQQLAVQQISQRLGFPDQSAFSRFFKANEGISPSEFREKK